MDANELRKEFERRRIRKVKVGGFDVDGVLRGKYISVDKFWSVLEDGFGFCDVIFGWDITDALYDNASVTGSHTGFPDARARIDPSSVRYFPYEADTAHFLVDFWDEHARPHPACPRNLMKRITARAEALGYRPRFGAEFEFWVFRESPESLHEKGFRNLTPLSPGMYGYSWLRSAEHGAFVHDIVDALREYDVPIEGIHTETGPGVYEVALSYDDALAAADKAALFKTTIKHIARRHDLMVTFMAKWDSQLPGSSGHIHQSLWDSKGEENLFADVQGEHGLSAVARHYLGGQVALMAELTAIFSPFVNSYKRYVPGLWAPLTAGWGVDNRTCAVRAITGGRSTRLEYRQTAADMNPYLAMAACLGAGLWGIEHGASPPPASQGDAGTSDTVGTRLPTSLAQATELFSQSERIRQVLGEAFVDHYARTRMWEVRQHERAVTDWELRRYFEAV